ncbi:MAG: ketoacyl-ACP synthase III [Candidatus Cloacimonetes bacterium]|jgi:3-oxoacyl-[acyl-carrier-protein] synthase-3|nr:ketoacyl-ACP synthase III [Candidatus Cloacimonadota bacterium]
MPYLKFTNVGITGISATVPTKIIDNYSYTHFMTESEVSSIIKMTGIEKRRFSDPETCSSDLSVHAARSLINSLSIDRKSIDVLIFVSQTPDYRSPPTSMLIADRLGFGKDVGAFDVNLGCSGFVYGLQIAFLYASQAGINKVLLLNGETKSKSISSRDKSMSLLFGDGATAVIVEKINEDNPTVMSMNSNGAGSKYIMMPAGGYRKPSSLETLQEREYPDGSIRNEEQTSMDGEAVFNFTISDVPKDIRSTLQESGFSLENIDYFVPHQANRFITDHIARKLKIPKEKILYSLQKYGNIASVTIPLTLAEHLSTKGYVNNTRLLLAGFGTGLSWGTIITTLHGCKNCGVSEYAPDA